MLPRCLAATALLCLLPGCLIIEERAVDLAAMAGPVPAIPGGTATVCMSGIGGEDPECHRSAITRETRAGAEWLVVTGTPGEPPMAFAFFSHGNRAWAVMRIDAGPEGGYLALLRARQTWGRTVLEMPLCGAMAEAAELGEAARAAGALVEEALCTFDDFAGLMDFAAGQAAQAPGVTFTIRP